MRYLFLMFALTFSIICGNAQSRYPIDGNSRQVSAHRYNARHAIEHRHHNGVEEGYRGLVDANFFAGNEGVFMISTLLVAVYQQRMDIMLIELQKTWLDTETLRSRRYLAAQYNAEENVVREGECKGYGIRTA